MFEKIYFKELSKNKDFSYAEKLPFFQKNKFMEFKPGLNIIYAPNGTGKSTILSMLALSIACKQGGYSVVTNDWNSSFSCSLDGIDVVHDGQGCHYVNSREAVGLIGGMAGFDDDFFDIGLKNTLLKESAGKTTLSRLNDVLAILLGQSQHKSEIEYRVKKLSPERCKILTPQIEKSQPSILLDEPESGLAIHVQRNIFNLLDEKAKEKGFQIIVASHSVFALSCKNANIIELDHGYEKIAKQQLMLLMGDLFC